MALIGHARVSERPWVITAEKLGLARTGYDSREHAAATIAGVLRTSCATLYRPLAAEYPAC